MLLGHALVLILQAGRLSERLIKYQIANTTMLIRHGS
jgi:hypothetical protein